MRQESKDVDEPGMAGGGVSTPPNAEEAFEKLVHLLPIMDISVLHSTTDPGMVLGISWRCKLCGSEGSSADRSAAPKVLLSAHAPSCPVEVVRRALRKDVP